MDMLNQLALLIIENGGNEALIMNLINLITS